jgi:hypothetical protein
MEKLIFRLLMAAFGIALFVWLVIEVINPLLQQAKNVSKVLGN